MQENHIIDGFLIIGGGLAWFVSYLFDLPGNAVLTAFLGAWIGIAMRDAVPLFDSNKAAIKYYLKTLLLVVGCTVLVGWAVAIALKFKPDIVIKSTSGLCGFAVIYFSKDVIDFIKFLFKAGKDAISLKLGIRKGGEQ